MDPDELSESDLDEDEASGTMLLPTHHDRSTQGPGKGKAAVFSRDEGRIRLEDVWDEREEIFGIGDESDGEGDQTQKAHGGPSPRGDNTPSSPAGPRIVVTSS